MIHLSKLDPVLADKLDSDFTLHELKEAVKSFPGISRRAQTDSAGVLLSVPVGVGSLSAENDSK